MRTIHILLIFASIILAGLILGCTNMQTETNCPELNCSNCPQIKCENLDCSQCSKQIETQTIMKYQCYDNHIKDKLEDCSTLEERASTEPIILTGSGNQVTDKFYLKQGIAIFKNKYNGDYNFIAYLIDSDGDNIDLVANTIGTSDTSSSTKITTAGYYRIEVTAWSGSDWTITVEQ